MSIVFSVPDEDNQVVRVVLMVETQELSVELHEPFICHIIAATSIHVVARLQVKLMEVLKLSQINIDSVLLHRQCLLATDQAHFDFLLVVESQQLPPALGKVLVLREDLAVGGGGGLFGAYEIALYEALRSLLPQLPCMSDHRPNVNEPLDVVDDDKSFVEVKEHKLVLEACKDGHC